jgi:diacylglycerol kinase family enzyme
MSAPIPVLINAGAGVDPSVDAVRAALAGVGVPSEIEALEGRRLTDRARALVRERAPMVVAAGGDGTVNAVAHALVGSGTALGVLPLGTLNHFAKDLGLPVELSAAAAVLARGRVAAIDVGAVNGRCFINNSSIGLYPTLVEDRERQRRELGRRKYVAMAVAIWRALKRLPLLWVRLEAAGRHLSQIVPFVFVGNNEYAFTVVPMGTRERLDRGRLWLYVPSARGRRELFRIFLFALFHRSRETRHLHGLPVIEATVRLRRGLTPVGIDGEIVRLRPPLRYRVLRGALKVVVP